MSHSKTTVAALSVGQLARRWAVSAARIRQLVRDGHLAEAFTIPASGRYGAIVKIPLSTVLAVEKAWAVVPPQDGETVRRTPRGRGRPPLDFRHFPDLHPNAAHDAGCREDVLRSNEHSGAKSG